MIGKGFKGHAAAVLIFAHQHRQPAQGVPGGDDGAVLIQNQNGHGAFNLLLGMVNALHQRILLVNKRRYQLRGIHLAGALGHKLMAVVGKIAVNQRVGVGDDAHRGDGIQPQVGAHQQGLGVGVADAAQSRVAGKITQILFKFRAKRGIFNVMNLAVKALIFIQHHHAAPLGTKMGMIVRAEKHIQRHITPGNGTKKTTHCSLLKM